MHLFSSDSQVQCLHIDIMGLSKLGCDRLRQEKVYVKFNTFQLDENIPADPFLRF